MNKTTKRLSIWAAVVAAILMIPFLGNWPWTGSDYVFAGVVLFGAATTYELVTKNMSNKTHRILVGIGVVIFLVLVQAWAVAGP